MQSEKGNAMRLIDLDAIKPINFPSTEMDGLDVVRYLSTLPTVDAYSEEQVDSIIQKADLLEIENRNLTEEVDWLKNCLNCEIRKECPRHCGKVVHGCDHWVYGDSVVWCKNCKHYDNSEGIQWCHLNSRFYPGGFDWHSFPEDGYCSYGERRTNASD